MPTIDVLISKDGSVIEANAIDFVGTACKEFTDRIAALGTTLREEEKPELYVTHDQSLSEGL